MTPEILARHQNTIVLVMDQDAADYYIELLEAEMGIDQGIAADVRSLRQQYEALWGEL